DITTAKAIRVPELKGNPIEFTKKISDLPKKVMVNGNKNKNVISNTATTTTLAIMKFLTVTCGYLLKKYKYPIDGIANSAIKCTPKDIPTTKAISNNHLFPRGSSIASTQRKPNHNSNASIKVAMAYTSVSTALNQKVSEKVNVNAPIKQLPNTAITVLFVMFSAPILTTFSKILVADQNINNTANALDKAETILTIAAILSGDVANIAAKAPII